MSIIMYGIPNCDTIKKAKIWLSEHAINFTFHNYRDQLITTETLTLWEQQVGHNILLNKKSTTWRNLTAAQQAAINNPQAAIAIMQANPTLIKRPIITKNNKLILVGFKEEEFADVFS